MRPRSRSHRQANMGNAAAEPLLPPMRSERDAIFAMPEPSRSGVRYGIVGAVLFFLVIAGFVRHGRAGQGNIAGHWMQQVPVVNNTHPTGAKIPKAAFVVLTDPREDHFANVIPMLAQVESKYGQPTVSNIAA